jgi:hypothetical protein
MRTKFIKIIADDRLGWLEHLANKWVKDAKLNAYDIVGYDIKLDHQNAGYICTITYLADIKSANR